MLFTYFYDIKYHIISVWSKDLSWNGRLWLWTRRTDIIGLCSISSNAACGC